QFVEVVLRPLRLAGLPLRDADRQADRLATVLDQLGVALLGGDADGVAAAEQFGQVDLQAADGPHRRPGDGRRLVIGEHDGVFRTDPRTGRTAALAVVLVLDVDALGLVDAVDAEQAEIEALHAIRTAAVIDDRVPSATRLLQQLLRGELRRRL